MDLQKGSYFLLIGTLLFSILLLYESKKLDGYEFPVYSTKFCPRNQTEWDERFSAINCNASNGYMCLPNRELTQLLEFCYIYPFLWMQEYLCFYLNKQYSRVNNYNCRNFKYGCPTSAYMSSKSFEHQSCVTIDNGCFIADPHCNSTTTSPLKSTDINYIDGVTINIKYNTTTYLRDSAEQNKGNEPIANEDWILPLTIILGILFVLLVVFLIGIYYRNDHASVKISRGVEEDEYEEYVPLNEHQDQLEETENGIDTASARGHASCNRSSDKEAHASGEFTPFRGEKEKYKLDSITKESQRDRVVFEDWEQINSKFIQTKACKKVENLVQKQNLVILVGHSGSGKSAIIQHIALKYRSDGWVVKRANDVKDAVDAFDSNNVLENQTLVVLNDPIGKESFDEIAYNSWKTLEDDFKACLKKFKLLLTCRKCVQSDDRAKGLFKNKSNIVDIDSDDCKLSDNEKEKIWNKYKSDSFSSEIDLKKILKIDAHFPLLCKLFFSEEENQKNGLRFFEKPVEVYKDEIHFFQNSSKEKYCALVLLVLFNNALCVDHLSKDDDSTNKFNYALRLCGMLQLTAPTLRRTLDTMKGSYVTKIGDTYQFCHGFVMEVTSYVFGSDYPEEMIKYADIIFLSKQVRLKGNKEHNDNLTIYISDEHLNSLGKRLLKEIVGKKLFDVVLNPCLKDKKVADAIIKNIKKQQEKIILLLIKKDRFLEKQNFDQESNDLVFTKLDFMGLDRNISPVCALIVFGHTDLSLYCLKTLHQLSINFNESSVFFAVCCNGSIDLFNMFSEYDIEEYLEKKCGYLYPIHIVSLFHNYEILQKIIELGVDLNQNDKHGDTALIFAVRNITEESEDNNTNARHYKTLQLLLRYGADINLCNEIGESPLYTACLNGHAGVVQLLLSQGADIHLCDEYGQSPLNTACFNGHDSTVQLLLTHGADINLCDNDGCSPLHIACLVGQDRIVQLLLSHEANINLCDKCGQSPFYTACENGLDSTVQLLLSQRANINLCNFIAKSPLYTACENGHNSTVQLLLSRGADINLCVKSGLSPLLFACLYGHDSTVQLLLNHGADINSCIKNVRSHLYLACNIEHDSALQRLLNHGADINSCNKHGDSLLCVACKNGRDSAVQLFLRHGADINLCNRWGYSPFYTACLNGHESTVQILMNSKANINLNTKNGLNPVFTAFYMRHYEIIETLLDADADTNIANGCGCSYVSSDWSDKDDITGQYLLRKSNIVNNMYDLESFFSLFVFCQVEELTRVLRLPSIDS